MVEQDDPLDRDRVTAGAQEVLEFGGGLVELLAGRAPASQVAGDLAGIIT